MEPLEIFDSINNKHINVYVTSEVAEKCRTDNAFAQDLFNKLQDQNIEDGSAIEIETIKCEVNEETPSEEKVDKNTWGRRETLKLIKAYQRHKDKFKEYLQKKYVWGVIANDLQQQGIYKSADKCAEKWKNLKRTYKNTTDKPSIPTRFQFLEEMQNIFNDTEVILSDSDPEEELEQKYNPELKHSPVIPTEELTEKESWSKYETLQFLKYYQKYKGKKSNFASEKQFWSIISRELKKDNIHKLPEKCATKWKNLYRSYKKIIDKPSLPLRFQYFQEVSDVINDVELQIPDDITTASDDVDFEKILDSDQFKCFLEKIDFYAKPKDAVSWTPEETLKLIKAYKKNKNRFRISPSKKYVWAIIVSELAKEGVHRDVEKCENKWKSLLRAYRRSKESGDFPRFTFYADIAECLNDNSINSSEGSIAQNDVSMSYETIEQENDDLGSADDAENETEDDNVDNAAYEEIIIQTEPDQSDSKDNKYWSCNDVSALIKAYASRHKQFEDPKKNNQMWVEISRDLAELNIQKSPEICEKKWKGLFNIYRAHKMKKSGPGKFTFFTEIDNIFKERQEEANEVEEISEHKEKCKCMKKRMLEKQQRHIERMQLLKRKLDLEERKVEAFEYYVKHLKTMNDR